jgi:hypothetical protein
VLPSEEPISIDDTISTNPHGSAIRGFVS